MIDAIGGRKVLAILACLIIAGATVVWKGDVPANFGTVLQWLFTAFIAGNGIEHLASGFGTTSDTAAPQEAPAPSVAPDPRIDELATKQAALIEMTAGVQKTLSFIITKTKLDQVP